MEGVQLLVKNVIANDDLIKLSRDKDGDKFNGVIVNLGALEIVTKVTLNIQKSYQVRQDVFQDLLLQSLKDHFNEILSSGCSVSLFTA